MKTQSHERNLKTHRVGPIDLGIEAAVIHISDDGTVTINGHDMANWDPGLPAEPAVTVPMSPFVEVYQRPDELKLEPTTTSPFIDAYQRPDLDLEPVLATPFVDAYQRADYDVEPEPASTFIDAYQRAPADA